MIDYARVEAELEELGYSAEREDGSAISTAVLNVLYSLEAQDLPQDSVRIVADLVSHFMHDAEPISETLGRWEQFTLGSVKIGSVVRVKWDAYDSETGKKHNGLVGIFLSALAGRCTIRYVGRKDKVDFIHPPKLLEVLRK